MLPPSPTGRTPAGAVDLVVLRRAVLAVCVLEDVDLQPGPEGVVLAGSPPLHVAWSECLQAVGHADPEGDEGRARLTRWLRARRWAADAGPQLLADLLRPVGLPVDHALHPGPEWVRERVLGGALDLGLGALGLDADDPERVVVLPAPALGLDAQPAWLRARRYLEEMGALAADLLARDARGQLRPVGDCDAVTLLGARTLRAALGVGTGGMCTAIVPMRRRGWTRLALVDPAFGPAAAAATDPADRGFARPLLLTADEVTEVPAGGRPEQIVLTTPGTDVQGWDRDVLYR